ncbi:MAG TPA: 4Fe-4S dicluster domain-containing protein [Syntrophales bacterium]
MSKEVGRRTVLKGITLGAFGLGSVVAVADLLEVLTFPGGQKVALAKGVILADKSLCSGCRICEIVCANVNSAGRNSPSLSRILLEKEYLRGEYQPKVCHQCADPPCLKACPVAALQVDRQRGTNARVIDERVCIGCQKCVEACRLHFRPARPRFDAQKHRSIKCHLCFGDPQCVKYCPLGVLRMERSEKGLLVGYPVIQED